MVSRFLNRINRKVVFEYISLEEKGLKVLMLDIGMNDYNRFWNGIDTSLIIGIDSKKDNIDVLSLQGKHNYILADVKTDLFQNKEFTSKVQNKRSFDIITSFYSLERYFDSKDSYHNLMNNASANLKEGAYFIIIGFSGERVNTLLSKTPKVERYYKNSLIWAMEKNYIDYNLNKPNFGVTIKYSVLKGLVKDKQLTNLDYVVDTASDYGFDVISQIPLEKYYTCLQNEKRGYISQEMTNYERELCFLNDIVVLRKKA